MIVLSHFQAAPLLKAREEGRDAVRVSPDLNRTECEVQLNPAGAVFPDGIRLVWEKIEEISENATTCFTVREGEIEKVQIFSPEFGQLYSLLPTPRAPALRTANFAMHRIKGIDPHEDTLRKVRCVEPVKGAVLDTATGLGYTAIQAAKAAARVTTIEIAPVALEIARRNPWSWDLFNNSRIRQIIGDASEEVLAFQDGAFDRIIHDPPTFQMAGELFSEDFYRQMRRVLKRGGRMFHYIGDVTGPMGSSVAKGAMRRLKAAGFMKVELRPEAYGLVAYG